jgi:ubiquinone/menaquinone biosynthesis C-methylase UbiE
MASALISNWCCCASVHILAPTLVYHYKSVHCHLTVFFVTSSGGKLPFDDVSLGAVLAVIKNVESLRDQLVSEISRVLKAGGRVLVQNTAPSSSQKVT